MKKLDEDEVGLEDDIDKVSLIVRAFIEQYNQEAFCLNVKEQETSEKRLRKHSFIQKYLERRKISKTQIGMLYYIDKGNVLVWKHDGQLNDIFNG